MQSHYLFLALDIARQRTAEAEQARLAALGHPAPTLMTRIRRTVARTALAVARAADETELQHSPTPS